MYKIKFSDKALNLFEKLDKNIQDKIGSVLERIKIFPEDFVDKLVGEQGYKLRVGDYKIFLGIFKEDLISLLIEIGYRCSVKKSILISQQTELSLY